MKEYQATFAVGHFVHGLPVWTHEDVCRWARQEFPKGFMAWPAQGIWDGGQEPSTIICVVGLSKADAMAAKSRAEKALEQESVFVSLTKATAL